MKSLAFRDSNFGGFTLVEALVSISLLFLGVISAGGVMITVQHVAEFTENRYEDYSDLRTQVENLRVQLSSGLPMASTQQFKTRAGHAGTTVLEPNAGGFPNLVRVVMTVQQDNGADAIEFVSYLRANDA